jgi:DNA-binding transcriptional ArsR family regulator
VIIIKNAAYVKDILLFVYNPLSELSLALDLISHPDHHPLHRLWAEDVIKQLSHKEKEMLKDIESFLQGYLNLDEYLDFTGYPFDELKLIDEVPSYIRNKAHWQLPDNIFDIDVLISFLEYMWISYIKNLVTLHLESIREQISMGHILVAEKGLDHFFSQVSERISLSSKGELKIEKWVESDFDGKVLDNFYIELTIFAFPHLILADRHESGSFWLGWDVPFLDDKVIAPGINRISSRAFALSNKSRLRLLLMISQQSMTQKELTKQMGFSKSTISRHINILIDAGLILCSDSERNSKLYVNRSTIKEFSKELISWIGEEKSNI